jgi:Uma2 family endonuclease
MGVTHVLPRGAPLSYDDLQAMPDDGHRYELVDGVLIVSPSPREIHQRAVGCLYRTLYDAAPPDVQVLLGPYDYVVSEHTVLVPDIVVARRSDFGELNIRRPPMVVVEVLSPSTRRIDMGTKRLVFEGARVPSYWLVDPNEPGLTVLELASGGRYVEVAHVTDDDAYDATAPFAVRVVPADLVR